MPKVHGYTMQKKKDSGPDPEMSERREQLRQKRREQMAKLSSTAKEKSKPPTYSPSSPFSHSDDLECSSGAEMMPARQKDGYRKTGTRANESHWSPEKRGTKEPLGCLRDLLAALVFFFIFKTCINRAMQYNTATIIMK